MRVDRETERRIASYGRNALFGMVLAAHEPNPVQMQNAFAFAREFRGDRSFEQFVTDEFITPQATLLKYSGDHLANFAFAVPTGPEALPFAPRRQWTTTSSRFFVNSERVMRGKPILAPSAYFEGRPDITHFSLPALMEHVFEQIQTSGKALAVWSGPEPFTLFWDNMINGSVYTPENAERWLKTYYNYVGLVLSATKTGNLQELSSTMMNELQKLGVSGPWAETQSGKFLLDHDFGSGLILESMTDEAYYPAINGNLPNVKLQNRLKNMEKQYLDLLAKYSDDPVMLEIIKKPVPIILPLEVPPDQPWVLMDQRYDTNYFTLRGKIDAIDDQEELVIRHPTSMYFPWRKGVMPENVDQSRTIKVHASVSDAVLERMRHIVQVEWGLTDAPIERLTDKEGFVRDCRIAYQKDQASYYTFYQARKDIDKYVLVPMFDAYLAHPHAIFSHEEYMEFAKKIPRTRITDWANQSHLDFLVDETMRFLSDTAF